MKSTNQDTRQHILDTGYRLIIEKGFTSVGLSELLKCAEVPKGSFYHYFKSKEQFGEALINDYFVNYFNRLEELFDRGSSSHYENLMGYWNLWADSAVDGCGAKRCLVVKLSAEISDLSEPMRLALMNGANRIVEKVANSIGLGISDGSIKVVDSEDAARFLYNLWLGSALMFKLTKDDSGLKQALHVTEQLLTGQIKI